MTVEIPDSLRHQVREGAAVSRLEEGEFVALAIAQALARLVPDPSLEARSRRATGNGWKAFLDNAADFDPGSADRLQGESDG